MFIQRSAFAEIRANQVINMSQKGPKDFGSVEAEEKRKCPDCGSTDVEYEHGEFVCKKCGLVIE